MSALGGLTPGAPPPPATRTLSVVLRDAMARGEEVRLIVAKGLADSGQNANAYLNVEIEGQTVTVPKLAGTELGGSGSGYPVYVLASQDFMLAVGKVVGAATPPGPLSVTDLNVSGTATIFNLNATNVVVGNDVHARDFYGRNLQLTGSANMNSLGVVLDISCRDLYPRGVGASGDINAQGWVQGGGVRTLNDSLRVTGNTFGVFGKSVAKVFVGAPPSAGATYGAATQGLINNLVYLLQQYGLAWD